MDVVIFILALLIYMSGVCVYCEFLSIRKKHLINITRLMIAVCPIINLLVGIIGLYVLSDEKIKEEFKNDIKKYFSF